MTITKYINKKTYSLMGGGGGGWGGEEDLSMLKDSKGVEGGKRFCSIILSSLRPNCSVVTMNIELTFGQS